MIAPFVQPSATPAPEPSSFQRAVLFVTDTLWPLAAVDKKIGFNPLHRKVNAYLGNPISLQRFEEILYAVNGQSWRQHACLLTAIVLGQGGMPGGKFFLIVKKFGAIPEFPRDNYSRRFYTGQLQYQVLAVAKSISKNKNF
jgi:hypothetical protein